MQKTGVFCAATSFAPALQHIYLHRYPHIIPVYSLSPLFPVPPSPSNACRYLIFSDSHGMNPLHHAGSGAVVQALIAVKVDPNAKDRCVLCSHIFRACTSAHIFSSISPHHPCPLSSRSPPSPSNACRYLIFVDSHRMMTPLHFAARGGHPAVVQALIAGKADPNAKDRCVLCSHIFRACTSAHINASISPHHPCPLSSRSPPPPQMLADISYLSTVMG
jgi:ankyrin repeat protein